MKLGGRHTGSLNDKNSVRLLLLLLVLSFLSFFSPQKTDHLQKVSELPVHMYQFL
jgi:hypothetical protein